MDEYFTKKKERKKKIRKRRWNSCDWSEAGSISLRMRGEKRVGGEWLKKKVGVKVAEVSRLVSGGETS